MNDHRIHEFLKSFPGLTDEDIANFAKLLQEKTLKRSEFFIREGQISNQIAIVKSGSLRTYYTSDKGEEITYCLTLPTSFLTAYSSFLTGLPTQENIQAITPTELWVAPKQAFLSLAEQSSNWTYFLKSIAEQQYIELEKRIFQLQKTDATYRYTELVNKNPELIRNIPLQYLASYLGITQRHLSRIRKAMHF